MTLILKHWKPLLFAALLLALCLQTWRADNLKAGKIEAEKSRNEAVNIANGKTEETTRYVNAFQNQVTKTKIAELGTKNALELQRMDFLKQFENLKKHYQNLEGASDTELSISGDNIVLRTIYVPCKDSTKAFDWSLHDEFNDIQAKVLDTPKFKIRVPLYSVDMWERRKLIGLRIGRKEWFREITSPNKLVSIDSAVVYKIRKK